MKKKISICFFAGICLLSMTVFLLQIGKQTHSKEKNAPEQMGMESEQTEALKESMAVSSETFYLDVVDDYIVVLKKDRVTVYFETNIRYRDLPDTIQAQIRDGMAFTSESELFDFLESYSS